MVEVTMERRHGRDVKQRHQRALRVAHALSTLRCSIVRGGSTVRHVTEECVVTARAFGDGTTYTVVYTGSTEEMATLCTQAHALRPHAIAA